MPAQLLPLFLRRGGRQNRIARSSPGWPAAALSRAAQAKLTLGMTRRFLVCAVAQVVRPGIFPNSSEDALLVLPLNTDAVNRNITVS